MRALPWLVALLLVLPLAPVAEGGPVPMAAAIPTFQNVTATAGVGALNTALPYAAQVAEDAGGFLNGGKGGAWFDYDRDGWEDLIVTGYYARALLHSNGDGTFTDVTAAAGLTANVYGMGVIAPDINNDGWPDLVFGNWFMKAEFFINNGDGTFTNKTTAWNIWFNGPSAGISFGDLDGDGWGDIYMASYNRRPNGLFRNVNGTGLVEMAKPAGVEDTTGFTFQTIMFDYDRDGDLDLYDVNDFGPDALYRNDGNWVFTTVTAESGVGVPGEGMGGAIGDVNDDGYMDIFVTNFDDDHLMVYDPATRRYAQQAQTRGISDPNVGWGVHIQDFNNDGYVDVFVADGRVIPNQGPEPDKLFLNQGNGTFAEVGAQAGLADYGINRGSAAGDFDRDGRMDLWVSNVVASSSLQRNTFAGGNGWLEVAVEGVVTIRDGVGARVTLTAANRTQVRDVHMGSSYLSQDSMVQHFGLGSAPVVDELTVDWPSGAVQRFSNVSINQRLSVKEWEGSPPAAVAPDVAIDAGDAVVFDGRGCSDDTKVASWNWRFSGIYGGVNLTGQTPNYTFYFPGNFTGTLTVTDYFGNVGIASFNLSVRPVGHPLVYIGPDREVAEDTTHAFSADLQGSLAPDAYNQTTFSWRIEGPNGTALASGRNMSYTFGDPGYFVVRVKATDQFGASGNDSLIVHVIDAVAPAISFAAPSAAHEDTLLQFNASGTTDNDPLFAQTGLFYWRLEGPLGQAEVQTGAIVNFSLRDPGINSFSLTVNDSAGNIASQTFIVIADDITAPVAEAGGDRVVRGGNSVTLDASPSSDNDPLFMANGVFQWTYDGPDGAGTLFGLRTSLTCTLPGVTTVHLRAIDPAGNPSVVDDVFTIRALDQSVPLLLPMPDLTASVGVDFELRSGNLSDNDPNFAATALYDWTISDGGDIVSMSGPTVHYAFKSVGRWPVTLTVTDLAGNAASQRFNVTVVDMVPPEALGTVPASALAGDSIVLNATASRDNVAITSYAWAVEGPQQSIVLNGVYLVWRLAAAGNYTVTLTVRDAAGHASSKVFVVEVSEAQAPPATQPPPPTDETPVDKPTADAWVPMAAVGVVAAAAVAVGALMAFRRRARP